ncbi:MAG: rRNA (cytidine-2'-O-)-methyltransferase, partial [Comamonadaceae bacterium]
KQFETIERMPCATFSAWLAADANRLRGEYVVGIHAVERVLAEDDAALDPEALRVLTVLLSALPVKTAAQLTSTLTGESKNKLYAAALTLKETA